MGNPARKTYRAKRDSRRAQTFKLSLPGIVDYDIEGNSRPAGSIWDIGAYEYTGAVDVIAPASPTGLSVS